MKAEVRSSQDSSNHDPRQEHVRRQLSVGFIVYRSLISQHLLDNPQSKVTKEAMDEMHQDFSIYWHDMFDPAVAEGMGVSDEEFVKAAAGKYSGDLAKQVNEVSDRAFIEGYNAALNKGWERAVAWNRISTTYGLDPAQMRSWVTYYPSEGYHPTEIPRKSQDQADALMYERATRIASHEAWSLKQMGKQAEWTQQIMKGELSPSTKKIWVTAQDELVCPVCAPMDSITVGANEQFKTSTGKFFAPPVHINCRCEIYLQFDPVAKAMGNDRFNRDANGRFSRVEGRSMRAGRTRAKGRGERQEELKSDPMEYKVPSRAEPATATKEKKKDAVASESKSESKTDVKQATKNETKTETKIESKTETSVVGNKQMRQATQNATRSKLRIDPNRDMLIGASELKRMYGDDTDFKDRDAFPIDRDAIASGSDVDELMTRLQYEDTDSEYVHYYVVDSVKDAEMRVDGVDPTYVVTTTMEIPEGDFVQPDLLRVFGGAGEDVSHSRDENADDERAYLESPKTVYISRLTPLQDVLKDGLADGD